MEEGAQPQANRQHRGVELPLSHGLAPWKIRQCLQQVHQKMTASPLRYYREAAWCTPRLFLVVGCVGAVRLVVRTASMSLSILLDFRLFCVGRDPPDWISSCFSPAEGKLSGLCHPLPKLSCATTRPLSHDAVSSSSAILFLYVTISLGIKTHNAPQQRDAKETAEARRESPQINRF